MQHRHRQADRQASSQQAQTVLVVLVMHMTMRCDCRTEQSLRGRTLSHGMSPLLVLMLFVSSLRGRYAFVKTSFDVSKGDDG